MIVNKLFSVLLFVVLCNASKIPRDRVVDVPLSDKDPGTVEYDHDAFLGKKEAEEFDDLPEDEVKRRLEIIAHKIDKDGDGKVSESELQDWITFTQLRYIHEDADKQFDIHDNDKDGQVHWDEYKKVTYGFLEDDSYQESEEDGFSYSQMMARDRKRWDVADQNSDEHCSKEEFRAFLHPEEFEHMKNIVTIETMDDIDKNKDGFIDIEEYIGDMFNPDESAEDEPEWVETEKHQFKAFRDKDKDGKLNLEEVRAWILPDDYNHAEAEARHLVYEADDDKDGELSISEIVAHHSTFVGSQATDWGEGLTRHDEF